MRKRRVASNHTNIELFYKENQRNDKEIWELEKYVDGGFIALPEQAHKNPVIQLIDNGLSKTRMI